MSDSISRRQFFRLDLRAIASGVRAADRPAIRPPGALPTEAAFVEACDGCRKCSQACPYDVILHLGPDAGTGEGTPYLDPEEAPCRWCASMDCVQACPTGALRLQAGEAPAPIAVARLQMDACLNSQGTLCDECATACPANVRAIRVRFGKMPELDPDACVGCGLCAWHCAAEQKALIIEPLTR